MNELSKSVKDPNIKRLIKAAVAQAKASARADLLLEIKSRIQHEIKMGIFQADHFISDLAVSQRNEDAVSKGTEGEALNALASLEVDRLLQKENFVNPDVIAQAITLDSNIKPIINDNGELSIVVESKTGFGGDTLTNHIKQMRTNPNYSFLFAEKDAGGPVKPAATRNPWKKETFNLTQQGKIWIENRPMAEKMKQEAGIA